MNNEQRVTCPTCKGGRENEGTARFRGFKVKTVLCGTCGGEGTVPPDHPIFAAQASEAANA
jgi:DnaJ-class molecular chaperone